MAISIQTNVNSVVAQENLRVTNEFQGKTIERLTSGYRINSSGDDAAGLAVANKFRSDIAELSQGVRNANDGLSQLQIVDSGLNNISKILDRLKTLATQSASSTFTGDRTILSNEYQDLLSEINRQAANIGLGSGTDTAASRNFTAISVYIGGGSAQTNSKIGIDLMTNGNLVNATGLLINTSTIAGGSLPISFGDVDLSGAGPFLVSSSQTFYVATTTGTLNVQVVGGTAGLTGAAVIDQLNAGVAGTGISFSANATTGMLQVSSANSFAVWAGLRVGTGSPIQTAEITSPSAFFNTGKYNFDAGTFSNIVDTSPDQVITFTPTGGTAFSVTLAAAGTIEAELTSLKAQLVGKTIDAVRAGNDIVFQSTADFQVTRITANTSAGGFANIPITTDVSAADKLSNSDPTVDALIALASLGTAVARLGTVQGKVGTGQNKLLYSIQLAQSQLTGYAAAESRIRDADVAIEAANLTKVQVLTQASIAAMAQANSAPQQVLALLRG
jgi:flagellin